MEITQSESKFLSYLKGLSIFVIVFGHVGGFWVFRPYSEFLHVFVPIFFFISGAFTLYSFKRSSGTIGYYKKRLISLLIPYYLLCLTSLLIYIVTNQQVPPFDFSNLMEWVQIKPSREIAPFPIGQIWFLHVLVFITLVSPLYFYLLEKNKLFLLWVVLTIIIISGAQLFINIDKTLSVLGNKLYIPLIHSSFYILGILYICFFKDIKMSIMFVLCIAGVILSVATQQILNLNIDYAFHTSPPDLYYVSGSFSAIFLAVIFKRPFVWLVQSNMATHKIFNFLNKHTFSIFLLHTLAIHIAENAFGLIDPPEKTLTYGIVKLAIVIIITSILAPPFTKISKMMGTSALRIIDIFQKHPLIKRHPAGATNSDG